MRLNGFSPATYLPNSTRRRPQRLRAAQFSNPLNDGGFGEATNFTHAFYPTVPKAQRFSANEPALLRFIQCGQQFNQNRVVLYHTHDFKLHQARQKVNVILRQPQSIICTFLQRHRDLRPELQNYAARAKERYVN